MNTQPFSTAILISSHSIAYACVALNDSEKPQKILDLGVHCFVPAVDWENGLTLNKIRKSAQNQRNRRHHARKRLNDLRALLSANGVVNPLSLRHLNNSGVWQLRLDALDRQLSKSEWATVLLHLIKNRGVSAPRNSVLHKNQKIINAMNRQKSKDEFSDYEKEMALINYRMGLNAQQLSQSKYRTVAEMAVKEFLNKPDGFIRNRQDCFDHIFSREDVAEELKSLFTRQRELGNPFAQIDFQNAVEEIFLRQEVTISADEIKSQIGFCTLEQKEYRAPKNCYSYEKFVLLQKLADLQIYDKQENEYFYLADDEIEKIKKAAFRDEIHTKKGNRLSDGVLKYTDIRKMLQLGEEELFKNVKYVDFSQWQKKNKNKSYKDFLFNQEDKAFMEMPFYAGVRSALWQKHRKEWESICRQPEILDKIGEVFLYHKQDVEIIKNLPDVLSKEAKQSLTQCDFSGVGSLSLKAIRRLLTEMEKGKSFGEAKELLYSNHIEETEKHFLLPRIDSHQVRNPVLYQALCEARFVLNRIIKKFGTPHKVHILTHRQLAQKEQSIEEIQQQQEKNRKKHEKAIAAFQITFPNINPNENDLLKFKLWEEQNHKCLYSGETIDKHRLLDNHYADIDHAIPFSKSANNSQDNKVLALVKENRQKGNQTPFEYLKGQDWNLFVQRVEKTTFSSAKKQLLLWQKVYRNQLSGSLNDASIAATVFAQHIEKYLFLNSGDRQQVLTIKQGVADYLSQEWAIQCAGDWEKQAALAAVTACATPFFQMLISNAAKTDDDLTSNDYWDNTTGEHRTFPLPFANFESQVRQKLGDLTISSHAVKKTHNKAHNDTIYHSSGCLKVSIDEVKIEQIEYLKKRERAF